MENKYVAAKFNFSDYLYDETSIYLKSIQKYHIEINNFIKKIQKWHFNQIISQFPIKYPDRMVGKDKAADEKRKKFRKEAANYKLDDNNRLLNPLKKENEKNIYYKIPFLHEKTIVINTYHIENNHCGRIQTINFLHNNNWYFTE